MQIDSNKSKTVAVDQVTLILTLYLLLWRHLFQNRHMLLSSKRKKNAYVCVYMHIVVVYKHT